MLAFCSFQSPGRGEICPPASRTVYTQAHAHRSADQTTTKKERHVVVAYPEGLADKGRMRWGNTKELIDVLTHLFKRKTVMRVALDHGVLRSICSHIKWMGLPALISSNHMFSITFTATFSLYQIYKWTIEKAKLSGAEPCPCFKLHEEETSVNNWWVRTSSQINW